MSFAANISVEPAVIDGDELWLLFAVDATPGIKFSLRDLSARTFVVEEELVEEDDEEDWEAEFVGGANEIFGRTPSPFWLLVPGDLDLLLLLPLLLLMFAFALSASFSWHIIFNRRLMGVDSGPKKSEMVLERAFRNASCRLITGCCDGGLRC